MRTQSATTTITYAVTVAAGVFAPGHLGELTQYLPFELVDDVLEQTRTVQRRLRALPSRTGVYFLLALGMFPRLGYARVRGKLTAGLHGLAVPHPSEKALRDLRRRLGPAPLKALFEVVAGPLAQPGTPGARFGGLRTVAFDGCNSLKVPGTDRNRSWLGRIRYRMGFAGYPTLRLMTLAETGTRGLLGAALGSGWCHKSPAPARPCSGCAVIVRRTREQPPARDAARIGVRNARMPAAFRAAEGRTGVESSRSPNLIRERHRLDGTPVRGRPVCRRQRHSAIERLAGEHGRLRSQTWASLVRPHLGHASDRGGRSKSRGAPHNSASADRGASYLTRTCGPKSGQAQSKKGS